MIRNMASSPNLENIILLDLTVCWEKLPCNPYLNHCLLLELCFTESYNHRKPLKI